MAMRAPVYQKVARKFVKAGKGVAVKTHELVRLMPDTRRSPHGLQGVIWWMKKEGGKITEIKDGRKIVAYKAVKMPKGLPQFVVPAKATVAEEKVPEPSAE